MMSSAESCAEPGVRGSLEQSRGGVSRRLGEERSLLANQKQRCRRLPPAFYLFGPHKGGVPPPLREGSAPPAMLYRQAVPPAHPPCRRRHNARHPVPPGTSNRTAGWPAGVRRHTLRLHCQATAGIRHPDDTTQPIPTAGSSDDNATASICPGLPACLARPAIHQPATAPAIV